MDDYVQNNIPTSVTGFVNDLYYAKSKLLEADTEAERKRGAIGKLCLQSGCDIYIKGVTRGINQENFDECIRGILARSSSLKELSLHKRRFIADNGKQLIRDGMVPIPAWDSPKDDSDTRRLESGSRHHHIVQEPKASHHPCHGGWTRA